MKKLWILLIIVFLGSCVTQKRCLKKFPPVVSVDTIVHDTTIYRDTTVYEYIEGDTVYNERIISIPKTVYVPPVEAETEFAHALAWIQNQRLRLELRQKDSLLQFRIDSAIRANQRTEYITKVETHQLLPKPFFKWWFFGSLAFIILLILAIIRKLF